MALGKWGLGKEEEEDEEEASVWVEWKPSLKGVCKECVRSFVFEALNTLLAWHGMDQERVGFVWVEGMAYVYV